MNKPEITKFKLHLVDWGVIPTKKLNEVSESYTIDYVLFKSPINCELMICLNAVEALLKDAPPVVTLHLSSTYVPGFYKSEIPCDMLTHHGKAKSILGKYSGIFPSLRNYIRAILLPDSDTFYWRITKCKQH